MHRTPPRSLVPTLLFLSLGACSSEQKTIHVDVTTGHETDTFSMDPPVTRVTISAKSQDGSTSLLASVRPGESFDLGDVTETQSVGFEVQGLDALGHVLVRGSSLNAISLLTTPDATTIPIFVQRLGQWARPPGGLLRAHVGAPAGALPGRFVWQAGGTSLDADGKDADPTIGDFYDLFALNGVTGPTLSRSPETLVSLGANALIFDAKGGTNVDFNAETQEDLALPTGLSSFGDVAGGRPAESEDGTTFLVGGTRVSGEKTRAVLIIASDGSLTATTLNVARLGATALWVPNLGLVVAGGSDTGAGVEVLPANTTSFVAGGYPIDPVVGAGAVLYHPEQNKPLVALVGGTSGGAAAPTRLLDLNCSSQCGVTTLEGTALPRALTRVSAYAITRDSATPTDRVLAVGDEAGGAGPGQTRTYLVDFAAGTATELPLREPRKGASAIPSPLGTLALLGGAHLDGTPALPVETFFPQ